MVKNNKTYIRYILIGLGGVVLILLLIGLFLVFTNNRSSNSQMSTNLQQSEGGSSESAQTSQTPPLPPGSYQVYEPSKLSLADTGQVVLFFNAKWCPECQVADKNFKKEPIPEGLTILSVDYDKYTDLKKKYGVTYQHTFVQVDSAGNMIKKWSGSYNVADVEKNLQK